MNIIIYDDDSKFIEALSTAMLELNVKHNGIFGVPIYLNDIKGVMDYVDKNKNNQSVFLLDIVTKDESVGYIIARYIKATNPDSIIIYVTDFPEIIIRNMKENINALGFVIKTSSDFFEELEYALLYAHELLKSEFFISGNGSETFKIKYDDIFYFEKKKGFNHCQGLREIKYI